MNSSHVPGGGARRRMRGGAAGGGGRTEATVPLRAAAKGLASSLSGQVVRPGDQDYEDARHPWNGMIDRHPALVARCTSDEDVAAAIRFAQDHGLVTAVHGGGHGVAGQAVCDDGLVVDLTRMRTVEVDPGARTVRAQGGCTLGDLDGATQPYGLAASLGVVSATGIAGLSLSGGMGWLRRKYGLSCDNLVAATVVTADGHTLTVSAHEHPDLFWAIRGGGGNFGVVTSFTFRLHPVGPDVFVLEVFYPVDRATEVLRSCEQYVAGAPHEAGPLGVFGHVPDVEEFPPEAHGQPFLAVLAVHPGEPEEGGRTLGPLREVAQPIRDLSATMPYDQAQRILDDDYPDARRYYWKSVNVPALGDDLIARLTAHTSRAPSADCTVDVWFQGGAMADVGEQETAFANRRSPYLIGIEGNWDEESDSGANIAWVRHVHSDTRTFSAGGTYLNFPGFMEEGETLAHEGYGPNYDRLAAIKARYDPGNFFHLNANVVPAR